MSPKENQTGVVPFFLFLATCLLHCLCVCWTVACFDDPVDSLASGPPQQITPCAIFRHHLIPRFLFITIPETFCCAVLPGYVPQQGGIDLNNVYLDGLKLGWNVNSSSNITLQEVPVGINGSMAMCADMPAFEASCGSFLSFCMCKPCATNCHRLTVRMRLLHADL